MRTIKLLPQVIYLAVSLSGCATQPSCLKEERDQQVLSHLYCSSGQECDLLWARAQVSSTWRVQTVTGSVIQVFEPGDETSLAYMITKEPQADGRTKLSIKVYRGNTFGSIPDTWMQVLKLKTDIGEISLFRSQGEAI